MSETAEVAQRALKDAAVRLVGAIPALLLGGFVFLGLTVWNAVTSEDTQNVTVRAEVRVFDASEVFGGAEREQEGFVSCTYLGGEVCTSDPAHPIPPGSELVGSVDASRWTIDANNDALADYRCEVENPKLDLPARGNGGKERSGVLYACTPIPGQVTIVTTSIPAPQQAFQFGDLDKDGVADFMILPDGSIEWLRPKAEVDGFTLVDVSQGGIRLTDRPAFVPPQQMQVADLDGDLRADAIRIGDGPWQTLTKEPSRFPLIAGAFTALLAALLTFLAESKKGEKDASRPGDGGAGPIPNPPAGSTSGSPAVPGGHQSSGAPSAPTPATNGTM
jgi:hypothetical protein